MDLRPEEITGIIKSQIRNYDRRIEHNDVGTVITIGDGIARIYGLDGCMSGELLEFDTGIFGDAKDSLKKGVTPLLIGGCITSQKAHLLSELGKDFSRLLVVAKDDLAAKELYDAIMADWNGYDELRRLARAVPCFGNGEEKYDENAVWVARVWSDTVNSKTGPRGRYKAGLWSIARHVADGPLTNATPDGRKNGDVLSDGIGPVQGTDTSGPTALLRSIAAIDHRSCPNGTLLNMRFSPSALKTDEDLNKLVFMIRTFFAMGGMHLQFNFVKTETMKQAKVKPKEYKDLVVRVAGFSAYFTELHPGLQDEIIRRTELQSV